MFVSLGMRAVHHLLDLAGARIGSRTMDTRSVDSGRTLVAVMAMGNLRERLARISRHARRRDRSGGNCGRLLHLLRLPVAVWGRGGWRMEPTRIRSDEP